jgi:hypothetical protein
MPQTRCRVFAKAVNQQLRTRAQAVAITGDTVVAIVLGLESKLHSGTGGDTVADPIDYSAVIC